VDFAPAQDRVTWIGKRVPPDQLGDLDTGIYWDAGDGGEHSGFLKASRKLGERDAGIVAEWRVCEQAALWTPQRGN
jgi:hypothetical protein